MAACEYTYHHTCAGKAQKLILLHSHMSVPLDATRWAWVAPDRCEYPISSHSCRAASQLTSVSVVPSKLPRQAACRYSMYTRGCQPIGTSMWSSGENGRQRRSLFARHRRARAQMQHLCSHPAELLRARSHVQFAAGSRICAAQTTPMSRSCGVGGDLTMLT